MEKESIGISLRPSKCVKHPSYETLCAFSKRSWRTLFEAAKVRNDTSLQFLLQNGAEQDKPHEFYHRRCYQKYTHKHVDRISNLAEESRGMSTDSDLSHEVERVSDGENVPTPRTVLTLGRYGKKLNVELCLFCQQKKKKVKGTRQSLSNCMTFAASEAIYRAACIREDERVLLEVGHGQADLIAKEIRYHRSCYSVYTNQNSLDEILEKNMDAEGKGLAGKAHEKAFSSLQQEVKSSLLDQVNAGTVASMLELCSRYVTLLRAEGLEIDSYRADHLKIRLQRHFGDSLVFFVVANV